MLGENGTGKSNILSALKYFYDNLIGRKEDNEIFDNKNLFHNRVDIFCTYDVSRLKKFSYKNLKKENTAYQGYYEWITKGIARDQITIKMTKIKDNPIRWSHDQEIRKLIISLFPLYHVDSRNIDLINWKNLWKQIGDLLKLDNKTGEELKVKLQAAISGFDEKMFKRIEAVKTILGNLDVKVNPFSSNEFSAAVSQLYLSGNDFLFSDDKLCHFSNGTNAYHYTYLLIHILKLVAETKMKEPVLILDEPEISLHNQMVDNLTRVFYDCCENIPLLVATHSPRMVKNLLVRDNGNYKIYQVYQDKGYTKVTPFCMFGKNGDLRERFVITDQHAGAYFAQSLLLVEGETELELFQEPFLYSLFPGLNRVEVVKGMSNDVVYRILSPGSRNYNIPFVALMDMDKIYNPSNKDFESKYKSFKFEEKDKYYYYNTQSRDYKNRGDYRNIRKRMEAMGKNCEFYFEYPFFSSEDQNYMEFVDLLKIFLSRYGIFVAATTVEGMLITSQNMRYFIEFIKTRPKLNNIEIKKQYEKFIFEDSSINAVNFLRLLFRGKSDKILTLEQILIQNKSMNPGLSHLVKNNKTSKTAWVSDWIKFYFCSIAGIASDNNDALYEFQKLLGDTTKQYMILEKFRHDFSELNQLLNMLNRNIKK